MTTEARRVMDAAISEKDFQAAVVHLAKLNGWMVYHTFDSRRSVPGFPDLFLLRDGIAYAWELKRESDTAQPTPAQVEWLNALAEIPGFGHECVRVFRPSDWPTIEWYLKQRRPGRSRW